MPTTSLNLNRPSLFSFLGALLALLALLHLGPSPASANQPPQPNIVFILADDLGYGDLAANNPASRIPTPAMNRLATEGMRFTDSHSPSAVCVSGATRFLEHTLRE